MGQINALAGLIFTGGVLVGLCISIFTLRSYYAESLKRNIDVYKSETEKLIESLKKEIVELKGEF